MTYLSITLFGIAVLFVLFLLMRTFFSLQVCALCAAVSTTWLALLVLLYAGLDIDPILAGILIGGSVVGSMYLLEERLPERYHLFRLPFFLSLLVVSYFVVSADIALIPVLIVLFVWVLAATLFYWRHKPGVGTAVRKIIQCCKNW